jgi:antitoxin component YwqK of YwqJK toxin-antitoxin module
MLALRLKYNHRLEKHGVWSRYYKNGQIRQSMIFENGLAQGELPQYSYD